MPGCGRMENIKLFLVYFVKNLFRIDKFRKSDIFYANIVRLNRLYSKDMR